MECRSLAQNGHLIRKYDVAYFMASVDPLRGEYELAEATAADFPLLSDPSKEVADAYGVLQMGLARRETFYIGIDGTILRIDRKVNPATSAEDMAANLAQLGIAPAAPDRGPTLRHTRLSVRLPRVEGDRHTLDAITRLDRV